MSTSLQLRVDDCYTLAETGATKLAQAGLQLCVEEFCDRPCGSSLEESESILQSIEKASHRIGVDVAFQYAEHFYQEGDGSAARGWLSYAKMHAKRIGLNIKSNISEIKGRHGDRIPLFLR